MLLHFLPKVLEAGDQTVVQGLQLLRRLLAVDANPVGQDGDLEEETRALSSMPCFESMTMMVGGAGGSPAGR